MEFIIDSATVSVLLADSGIKNLRNPLLPQFLPNNEKERSKTQLKELLLENEEGLTAEGKFLASALSAPEKVTVAITSKRSDFGKIYYILYNNSYIGMSCNTQCSKYAFIFPLTERQVNGDIGGFIECAKIAEAKDYNLTLTEYFLILLLIANGRKKSAGKRFKQLFAEDSFSLLSYCKNFCIDDERRAEIKENFGEISLWRKAVDSLYEKGLITGNINGSNPIISLASEAEEVFSDKKLINKFVLENEKGSRLFRITENRGTYVVIEENGGVKFISFVSEDNYL